MTDHPLPFTASQIRAMLDGRKTQDRRVIKDAPGPGWHCDPSPTGLRWVADGGAPSMPVRLKYAVGDRIWVRESWRATDTFNGWKPGDIPSHNTPFYEARPSGDSIPELGPLRSPIHMPRWASRLTLIVESVRVQRLWEISESYAKAEGAYVGKASNRVADDYATMAIAGAWFVTARGWYRDLWNRLHGPDAWSLNPWVAAIGFRVIRANIDSPEAQS